MTPREHAVRALALYEGSGNADDHDPVAQREGLLHAIEQEIKTALVTYRARRLRASPCWREMTAEDQTTALNAIEQEVYR